ncbi:hypothetical protein WCE02_07595 [Pseudomonas juntendi]|uniref:hypothetical protein n=1 Tax=Pseudomonas TaxID=286 RepID=UPI0034D442BA
MATRSIYDRISQKREAAEALARRQAEQEREAVQALSAMPAPVQALPLNAQSNALRIAGLDMRVPAAFSFRTLETTLEFAGCEVMFRACLRGAPDDLELPTAIDACVKKLRDCHTELTLVRQAESLLAGHPAVALDYEFQLGQARRHGRTVCTIITHESDIRHWLEVSTQIDPAQAPLADWLIEFEAMLAGMTAQ